MFVNRTEELDTLEREYERETASLTIIYGRRRVGKTALITEFLRGKPESLYFLATEEPEKMNLKAFRQQVAEYTGNELLAKSEADWILTFSQLAGYHPEKRKIIVIDEFQYIGRSNAAFPSVMQKAWDSVLKDANVMLILCGSLIVSMHRQTLDYDSPLYGRRTAQIRLKQVPFRFYHEFFEDKTERELVRLYAVTGGVPKYINSFRDTGNIFRGIQNHILNPQSYLYEEPYFLLQGEVNEVGSYFSILRAMAMNNHKLAEISSFLGVKQTSLSKYLRILTDLDIIDREVPVTDLNPEKSKNGLYYIRDNYLAFWFRFVYPYRAFLEKGETEFVMKKLHEGFVQNYVSFVYEDICREKMWTLAATGELPFVPMRIGRYWGSACGETDIVAFTPGEPGLMIGECKFGTGEKGLKTLHELQAKAPALSRLTGTKAEEADYVIFSSGGYTKALLEEAERNKHVRLF